MPRLFSSGQIARVLERHGFALVSARGSHAKFRNVVSGIKHTAIVPLGKKEIPHGTFRSILRQSGLTIEAFEK